MKTKKPKKKKKKLTEKEAVAAVIVLPKDAIINKTGHGQPMAFPKIHTSKTFRA